MIGSFQAKPEVYNTNAVNSKKVHPRIPFTSQEDELLSQLVKSFGTNNWQSISNQIPGRNARQCRDRWQNYLSPDVVNGPWTAEEEELLVKKYEELGPSWKQIATFFPTRTDINIKSRWNLRERRIKKENLQIKKAIFCKKMESLPPHAIKHQLKNSSFMNMQKMQYIPINPKVKPNNSQIMIPQPINALPPAPVNEISEKPLPNINSSPLPFFTEKESTEIENDFGLKPSDDIFDSAANDCMSFLLMNEENSFNENFIDSWF